MQAGGLGWCEPWTDCLQMAQTKTGLELLLSRSLRAHSSLILCQDAAASRLAFRSLSLGVSISLAHTGSNLFPQALGLVLARQRPPA